MPEEEIAWISGTGGSLIVGHGPFTESDTPPNGGAAFYRNDFALADPAPWKIPARVEEIPAGAVEVPEGEPPGIDWESLDAAPFAAIFQLASAHIKAGDFEKTVPVVTEVGSLIRGSADWFRQASFRGGPSLVSYGWTKGDKGFAGATPERLFTLDGKMLRTMALAGTARAQDAEVFAVDEKEIREHGYVARTLVSKLNHLGEVRRHPREILHLGSLVHFLTRIDLAPAKDLASAELIRYLHPTPALGPLPRTVENLDILLDWRNRLACPAGFGAPFGFWQDGSMEAVVAIRGLWWEGGRIRLPAGCGLIEASRLVNEWRELRLKRDAVRHFFQIG